MRVVERPQRKVRLVAQPREDPPLHDQHGALDLGLVARVPRPRRQHRRAVVRGHLLVRALDAGLVAARQRHARLELVAHRRRGDAAKVREGPRVAADPVRPALRARRLRVREVRGAEHGDEQLHLDPLARLLVPDARLLARVVDEGLLAGLVHLAHRRAPLPQPPAVVLAELRVAVPVGLLLHVLEVQQLQRHADAPSLAVDPRAVRRRLLRRRHRRVQARLQLARRQPLHRRPARHAGRLRPPHRLAHGAGAGADALRHLPVAPPQLPLLPQYFPDVSHG